MLMKFINKYFFFAFSIILFSCSKSAKKSVVEPEEDYLDPRADKYMQRSNVDTLALIHNTEEYLELLKDGKINEALNKLYEASGDTVLPISDSKKEEIRNLVTVFPVLDYKIDSILLFSETDTEVRYTIEFFEKAEDDPRPNTLQCVLNPRRVGYYWYLTVSDRTYEADYRDN